MLRQTLRSRKIAAPKRKESAMRSLFYAVLIASVLWPALSFAQSIFIDSPSQGETVSGPSVTIRMSVTDFELGQDGRIRIQMDGYWLEETERLRVTFDVLPGTHELEARLVNQRGKPLAALPETVKFTVSDETD